MGLQRAKGATEGTIFVFPDGIEFQKYGVGWDDSANGYDLAFFDDMSRDVSARHCVDSKRVFIAGFSWGGDFAIALACQRGDSIRAIAANSTDDEFKDNARFMTYQGLPCTAREHPAIRFGHAVGGDPQYPAPDFATTSQLLRYLNACSTHAKPVKSSSGVMSCVLYDACAAEYVECAFDTRIGHTLPPNWAEDTWEYFSRF